MRKTQSQKMRKIKSVMKHLGYNKDLKNLTSSLTCNSLVKPKSVQRRLRYRKQSISSGKSE